VYYVPIYAAWLGILSFGVALMFLLEVNFHEAVGPQAGEI
jgi:hypothetical protein